ncbi:hypothetical protein Taro_046928 [Colocasia esculenta]|uniref:Protein kinase G11A n=1 Tax=Colocasia esculenta TaxID=4460 RepID=A0A843X652_COLES|nr:hypothetical protein [Colocasia esculenta]
MSQSDDLADDLKSMSFGSSRRSGSETVSTTSSDLSRSASAAADAFAKHLSAGGDAASFLDRIRRLRSTSAREPLSPADLRFVHRLGSGDIGSVYLAEIKCCSPLPGVVEREAPPAAAAAPPCVVAVKVMDKKELAGRSKEGRAKTEREILEMLDHPFLPRLYGCAENERWSFLVTEFCPGGDLHVLRQRQPGKRFTEPAVRFYAAEVVVALEYLHMMGIVYRDLKPENVLVRADGHIMLTDFDLSLKCNDDDVAPAQLISDPDHHNPLPAAAHLLGDHPAPFASASCILPSCIVPAVSCFNPRRRRRKKKAGGRHGPAGGEMEFVAEPVDVRSMSFVGTHEYLAPEIVSGEGHGSAVDWWTLGVFMFELLYGVTPFRGGDNEMTLANIVARALDFPKNPTVSPSARDLIAGLLVKDPAHRMGAATGAAAVKRHPFFSGVNWALLRCAKPPCVPPPFTMSGTAVEGSNGDASDDSSSDTPVEYY